jgi:hypothetical protein
MTLVLNDDVVVQVNALGLGCRVLQVILPYIITCSAICTHKKYAAPTLSNTGQTRAFVLL